MLRIHLLQHWFNLADNAVEEALYDIASLRRFVGIDLGVERVPDETTVLKFRHLLERHDLGRTLFAEVGQVLQASGLSCQDRHHRRRHVDRRAELDQERR